MGMWSEQDVDGHRCEVFIPEHSSQHDFTIIYLHDLNQQGLKDKKAFEESFEKYGLRMISPYTARSWWSDKLCAEFDPSQTAESYLLNEVLPWIHSHWGAKPPQIGLLGVGMGGQGGLRLGFKYPDNFPLIAAITPFIDHQQCWQEQDSLLNQMYPSEEAVRQDTATLHIHPLYWPRNIWFCCDSMEADWLESAQRLKMKLSALGIPHQVDLETMSSEAPSSYAQQMAPVAIEFLVERLEQERRRVQ